MDHSAIIISVNNRYTGTFKYNVRLSALALDPSDRDKLERGELVYTKYTIMQRAN